MRGAPPGNSLRWLGFRRHRAGGASAERTGLLKGDENGKLLGIHSDVCRRVTKISIAGSCTKRVEIFHKPEESWHNFCAFQPLRALIRTSWLTQKGVESMKEHALLVRRWAIHSEQPDRSRACRLKGCSCTGSGKARHADIALAHWVKARRLLLRRTAETFAPKAGRMDSLHRTFFNAEGNLR